MNSVYLVQQQGSLGAKIGEMGGNFNGSSLFSYPELGRSIGHVSDNANHYQSDYDP